MVFFVGVQCLISDCVEVIYLNIIGSMLDLMFGQLFFGVLYFSFKMQEVVVSVLVVYYSGVMGIVEWMLNGKFVMVRCWLCSVIV